MINQKVKEKAIDIFMIVSMLAMGVLCIWCIFMAIENQYPNNIYIW